ncbi:MAG: potassium channel family protein [Arachnia sp.]
MARNGSRLARWTRVTETPLTVAAFVFLVAWASPIIWPEMPGWVETGCGVVEATAWALFAIDYVVRLTVSAHRGEFMRTHLLDLAVVLLPMLRPLRLLRLITLVRFVNKRAAMRLQGRVTIYVAGTTVLLIFVGGLAVLEAERQNPEAGIRTVSDALFWAITTITTVGYGDLYPITTMGRIIAVLLMVTGVALLGTVTATLSSWFVERVKTAEDNSD